MFAFASISHDVDVSETFCAHCRIKETGKEGSGEDTYPAPPDPVGACK